MSWDHYFPKKFWRDGQVVRYTPNPKIGGSWHVFTVSGSGARGIIESNNKAIDDYEFVDEIIRRLNNLNKDAELISEIYKKLCSVGSDVPDLFLGKELAERVRAAL